MSKVSEMIKSLKGVIAALAVIILAQNFSVCFSVPYCVLCFSVGKATEEKRTEALTQTGNCLREL